MRKRIQSELGTQNLSLLWLILFFLIPLFYVGLVTFLAKGTYGGIEWSLSFRSIEKVMSLQYLMIFLRTVFMSAITALCCVLFGSLAAWFVVSQSSKHRVLFLMAFTLPFLINTLIRLYSLQSFVGVTGPLQEILRSFRPDFSSAGWSHNTFLMYLGLILTYLPFAIFPLTASFEKWDRQYFEAAQDLGASLWQSFFQVIWPLLKPSFIMAFFMVFIPCLGEYLVPEILGGSQKIYWGQLITEAFLKWRDWPVGSAFGLILILLVIISFYSIEKRRLKP